MTVREFGLEVVGDNGRKTVIRVSEITAVEERIDGTAQVYLRGDPDPFVTQEDYDHIKELLFETKGRE